MARETIVRWRRKTIITIEKQQRTFIRPLQAEVTALCEWCGVEVWMMTSEQAVSILQTTPHLINRLLEDGELHSAETESGLRLICSNSLFELSEKEKE